MENVKPKYEWGDGVYNLLSWFRKDRVKSARVLVAGAGALGNEVVKNLALFGVGHIYVVDFDRIELSNLTRSVLFREEDALAHAYKAEVVARRAMEINPQIKVTPIVGNLFSEVGLGLYRSVDVVIGCLDSRIARYYLNRLAIRAGKSWVDGGIENLTGLVRVFTPGISCYECSLTREEFNHIMLRMGCADVVKVQEQAGRVATTPVSASIIGAMQVQEAMKIIHQDDAGAAAQFKTLQGKMFHYEGMTCGTNIFRYASWKERCPAHEQWKHVQKFPGLSATEKVKDVLAKLKARYGLGAVEINMLNNKFVDKVYSDRPEKEFTVMVPESKLEEVKRHNAELRKLGYTTVLRQNFYEIIDEDFPYQDLTLQEVGIPLYDVLQVSTESGRLYVELSGDAAVYDC